LKLQNQRKDNKKGNLSSMRDPNRIDRIIEYLRQAWHRNPDWRLNQLIINAADVPSACYEPNENGLRLVPRENGLGLIYFIEDDTMEKRLKGMANAKGPAT
jgi:hypothetical protein